MQAGTRKGAYWLGVLAGLLILACAAPCPAEMVAGMDLEVLECGEFAEIAPELREPNPPCPALSVGLVRSSDVIEAAPMVWIGFTFTIHDPEEGAFIPFQVRVRKPSAYGTNNAETWDILTCTDARAFAGWRFAVDEGIEEGVWVVELLYDGEVLVSRPFDVRPLPEFVRTLPRVEGWQPIGDLRTNIGPGGAPGAAAGPGSWTLAASPTGIVVQVSACLVEANAVNDVDQLRAKGYPVRMEVVEDTARGRIWHTVRLGDFMSREDAEQAAAEFEMWENRPAFVPGR